MSAQWLDFAFALLKELRAMAYCEASSGQTS